jgi:hypothetical protein
VQRLRVAADTPTTTATTATIITVTVTAAVGTTTDTDTAVRVRVRGERCVERHGSSPCIAVDARFAVSRVQFRFGFKQRRKRLER